MGSFSELPWGPSCFHRRRHHGDCGDTRGCSGPRPPAPSAGAAPPLSRRQLRRFVLPIAGAAAIGRRSERRRRAPTRCSPSLLSSPCAVPQPLKVLRKTTPRRLAAAAPSQTPPPRPPAPPAGVWVRWPAWKIRLLIYGGLLFMTVGFVWMGDVIGAIEAACLVIAFGFLDRWVHAGGYRHALLPATCVHGCCLCRSSPFPQHPIPVPSVQPLSRALGAVSV